VCGSRTPNVASEIEHGKLGDHDGLASWYEIVRRFKLLVLFPNPHCLLLFLNWPHYLSINQTNTAKHYCTPLTLTARQKHFRKYSSKTKKLHNIVQIASWRSKYTTEVINLSQTNCVLLHPALAVAPYNKWWWKCLFG
jgi:hypothetical protein